MFEAFPKLTRFSHDWTVTEKIDGTNAQVFVLPENELQLYTPEQTLGAVRLVDGHLIYAGSRNRLIGLGKNDHHGFGQFVHDSAAEIVAKLGPGRHFGEWYGFGFKRKYNKTENRFALFNATRWTGVDLPDRVDVVPTLFKGRLEHGDTFDVVLDELKQHGSYIAEGFDNPEGIVMYHGPSHTLFKKTFDYDEEGKWADNQARKES